ncbi:hypothetical protein ACFQLX_14950 [Streptomyces polyrhachis]|uniref:Uncharacterized protein n=1 Tax=Streptomyces polyrhachis TaxID=1282885 RepID=A0ABW2GFD3_9ACTN
MRKRHPTEDELRLAFEVELASAAAGGGVRTETGLDTRTENALLDIVMAFPVVSQQLIDAARAAFAGQLDGTNAEQSRALLARLIEEHNRRAAGEGGQKAPRN